MDEITEQLVPDPIEGAEKDLTLACLREIEGKPTRKQIIEKLPPLGKAALEYDPEKDDFWLLMEKYDVQLTDEDYINFVSDLFFDMLRVQYTHLGTPDNLIKEAYNARVDSYKLWYTLFGFESKTYCNNKDYITSHYASLS